MKPLHDLTNWEKARLLAALFPEELPAALEAIKSTYAVWKNQEADVRRKWKDVIITADFWYDTAEQVNTRIEKYSKKLLKSPKWFADNLFDGYHALFSADCLQKYIEKGNGSHAFRCAVAMLFSFKLEPLR